MTKAGETLFEGDPDGLEGINAFYRDSLLPRLKSLEEQRGKAASTRETFHRILIPVWLFCGVSVFVWDSVLLILPLVLLTGFGLYYTHRERAELDRRHRSVVVSALAQFLGLQFNAKGLPVMVPHYQGLDLLPQATEILCEDGVRGTHGGVDFQTMAVRFQARSGWRLFGGREDGIHARLLSLRLPEAVETPVVVLPNRTGPLWETRPIPNGSRPVELKDPVFGQAFQVFSTDPAAARSVLSAEMREHLLALSGRYSGLHACFQDRGAHIVLGAAYAPRAGRRDATHADPGVVRDVLELLRAPRPIADGMAALAPKKT